jgi:hypothetical protein
MDLNRKEAHIRRVGLPVMPGKQKAGRFSPARFIKSGSID